MKLYDISHILKEGKFKSKQFGSVIFNFPSLPSDHHIVAVKLNGKIYNEFFVYSNETKQIERDWRPSVEASGGDDFKLEYFDETLKSYKVMEYMIKSVLSFLMINENHKFAPEGRLTKCKPKLRNIPIEPTANPEDFIQTDTKLDHTDEIKHIPDYSTDHSSEYNSDDEVSTPPKAVEFIEGVDVNFNESNNSNTEPINNNPKECNYKIQHTEEYLNRANRKQRRKNPADSVYPVPFTGCNFSPGRKNLTGYDIDSPNTPFKLIIKMKVDGKNIFFNKKEFTPNDIGLFNAAYELQLKRIQLGLFAQCELVPVDFEFIQKTNPATLVAALNFNSKIPWNKYKNDAIMRQSGLPKHSEIAQANRIPRTSQMAIPLDKIDPELLESLNSVPSSSRAHYYHYESDEYISVYGKRLPTKHEKIIKAANKRHNKESK